MAETLGSVIDYISNQLQGFMQDSPMYATLNGGISPSSLSLTLTLPAQAQPQGLVEIDGELIHVQSFDTLTGTATIPAWGRGQQGTTAATHASGARVTVNPRYPRGRIAQVVGQVIAGMCPPLFAVQRGSFDTTPLVWEYALPAGTRNLIGAEYRPFASAEWDWRPIRSAHIKRDSGSPMLHIGDRGLDVLPCEVRYTVATNPTAFTSEAQAFTTCGLPESCIDVVSLGAIPRLVSTNELARQQLASVEASERGTIIPAGSGSAAARFYMQMYESRLKAEVLRQRQEYPLRVMRTI